MSDATKQPVQEWEGESSEVPALGASFWKEGLKIIGGLEAVRIVKGERGDVNMYRLTLLEPLTLDGESVELVELPGNLRGVREALEQARQKGFRAFQVGDLLAVECTGVIKAKRADYSDSPCFKIKISRGGK